MTDIGRRERITQDDVVAFFRNVLKYEYAGNWEDRDDNRNIDVDRLRYWLQCQGHDDGLIAKVLYELDRASALGSGKTLYDANRDVYELLRYGVKVQPAHGEHTVTVWLIDWQNSERNDFAIAEEVTVAGVHRKRPDLVLYVNGIALGVIELKRSIVSVTEGIRQNLSSQAREFIEPFFTTVQLVMAGNDTEGLRYSVIGTPEKYWLRWKEPHAHPEAKENPLLRELGQLCRKERLLELVHDFVVFDAGTKKTARHNQYFGVRAAQDNVRRRDGGIIWHTQGSGKSLTMVWLAKWIREHVENGRVLIITDRTELDEQIEKVFHGVNEDLYRTRSGTDLVTTLNASEEWLIGSLIHKFGASDDGDIDKYLEDISAHLPAGFHAKGQLFVFVDECHRTQSGKLHDAMKKILPNATLIGFTGTPLLKSDKRRSIETFGPYIHTYKYDEAVRDGVVLDLRYEARDIDQHLTSVDRVDQWFEAKTAGLTDVAKAQLKRRWGTMRKVLSSRDRLEGIVSDIALDMETRDRLKSGHGNAILVSESIYAACRLYEMFQRTDLAGKCAIVTSYRPSHADIRGETTGESLTEKLLQYDVYRKMLAEHFREPEDAAMYKVEQFEKDVKKRFIEQPGQMKLLIVVDKLLTGFDAPPATYLYIDKPMQDHGLFQAICRVNRLDGEDKEYGYIIDYMDLFRSLEDSIKDYTSEALSGYDKSDVDGLLKDRLDQGRNHLETAREAIKALCEHVEPPRDGAAYRRHFVSIESGNAEQIKANEPKRVALYQLTAAYLRAYANLANDMQQAGYSTDEANAIKAEIDHFEKVRQEIKLASGDYVDMKVFEPAMRHLLDTYIRADASKVLADLDDFTLIDLIVQRGEAGLDALPEHVRRDERAVAETIENNVRRLIIDESPVNPKYYEKMSQLLDALIDQRRNEAIDYQAYLERIIDLSKQIQHPRQTEYPPRICTAALQAFYDNLQDHTEPEEREQLALDIDQAIRDIKKDDWRGNTFKEREVRNAIRNVVGADEPVVQQLFELALNQHDY